MMTGRFFLVLCFTAIGVVERPSASAAPPQSDSEKESATPPELGRIPWKRDFDAAQDLAMESKRPLLVLFDEVPGCATCQNFGREALSHPIVVDAAKEFVPVLVRNNVGRGGDRELLERFHEPAWNNPVVRMMRADGTDLVPRETGDWSTEALVRRMTAALQQNGQAVPKWLELVNAEYNPAQPSTVTVAMACYWEGEQKLGAIDGVIGSSIGMLKGREVVKLRFDAERVRFEKLLGEAMEMQCASRVYVQDPTQAEAAAEVVGPDRVVQTDKAVDESVQQQFHLHRRPEYYFLPLTASQATRLNSILANAPRILDESDRQRVDEWLSPTQRDLRNQLKDFLPEHGYVRGFEKRLKQNGIQLDRSPKGVIEYNRQLEALLAASE